MQPEIVAFSLDAATIKRPSTLPWLVLGKGPSSSAYTPTLALTHHVFALNHAVRGSRALIGHAIDIEVFDLLQPGDLDGVGWLCLPWIPHVRQKRPFYRGKAFFGPGRLTLTEWAQRLPLLADYLQRGRLMAYNFSSAPRKLRNDSLPTIEGDYSFSAAVAVRLLAQCGARTVRTLGVDGGRDYSNAFTDVSERTRLQTAQTSFDAQFQEIANTMNQFDLELGPLSADLPARVFVGCMPEQDLAYRVLEYSIHRHASLSVQVERLHEAIARQKLVVPTPHAPENRGRRDG